ncbi:MAG: InlB B-repeat-containing protein [Oscillospiraceae bacterium]|nr:InlB B-repeat-containing protein [Oscillospiraceae bacterium]
MKKMTMKTIAATLAAASILSVFSTAVRADALAGQEYITLSDFASDTEDSTTGNEPAGDTQAAEEPAAEAVTTSVTITFDSNGGTEVAPVTGEPGTAVEKPEDPRRAGYTFSGWDTQIPETMPESDMTITATWTKQTMAEEGDYTISFNTGDGTAIAPITVHSGDVIPQLPTPSSASGVFSHWDMNLPETMPSQNIELTAIYAEPDASGSLLQPAFSMAVFESDKDAKQYGIEMADAAFDQLADEIPCGKILMQPFKSLFHGAVDNEDPLAIMSKKLDQMDAKLDEINSKIDSLDSKVDENTRWLENATENAQEMSDLKGYFRDMSPKLRRLSRDIEAIETDTTLSNSQKIMRIAKLTEEPNYDEITDDIFRIQSSLGSTNTNVYGNFFKTLYNSKALNRMVSREAYNDAKEVADDLCGQYLYAVALMTECQTATQAVGSFRDKEIADLGEGDDLANFKSFNAYRHSFDNEDPRSAIVACANGYKAFTEAYDKPTLIWYGKKDIDLSVRQEELWHGGQNTGVFEGHTRNVIDDAKNNVLTFDEVKELANYVTTNYPGRSLKDFFEMYGISMTNYVDNNGQTYTFANTNGTYIVVGGTTDSCTKDNGKSWGTKFCGEDFWDHKVTCKAINITDSNCAVQDLLIETYRERAGYDWGITVTSDSHYNSSYMWHLYAHLEQQ